MGFDSIWHWLILLVLVLLVFGTGKLRKIGPDLGNAVREFKKALSGDERKKDEAAKDEESLKADPPAQAPAASATQQQAEHESVHSK